MTKLKENLAGQWKDAANLVLGAWLVASPWVLSFADQQTPSWNAWIVGVVIALAALAALIAFQQWEEWINIALGAWLIVSPYVLAFTGMTAATWNHIVVGALVGVLAMWAAVSGGEEVGTKT